MSSSPFSPSDITRNQDAKRFEITVDGHVAFANYIHAGPKFFVTHTEVPPALEGRGIGSTLIKYVLEWIESEGLLLVPLCPFTAAYLQRHPEWQRILAPGYSV